jgi:hypothetical protein
MIHRQLTYLPNLETCPTQESSAQHTDVQCHSSIYGLTHKALKVWAVNTEELICIFMDVEDKYFFFPKLKKK